MAFGRLAARAFPSPDFPAREQKQRLPSADAAGFISFGKRQKKRNQRKTLSLQSQEPTSEGLSGFSDSPSVARSENAAHPWAAPCGFGKILIAHAWQQQQQRCNANPKALLLPPPLRSRGGLGRGALLLSCPECDSWGIGPRQAPTANRPEATQRLACSRARTADVIAPADQLVMVCVSDSQLGGSGQSASWLPSSTRRRSRGSICGASTCTSSSA